MQENKKQNSWSENKNTTRAHLGGDRSLIYRFCRVGVLCVFKLWFMMHPYRWHRRSCGIPILVKVLCLCFWTGTGVFGFRVNLTGLVILWEVRDSGLGVFQVASIFLELAKIKLFSLISWLPHSLHEMQQLSDENPSIPENRSSGTFFRTGKVPYLIGGYLISKLR